ncbi:hypothetical protein B0O99DRAFT_618007 [Bisporella sp. PMI_857]|nr:hypothetical protein B0O99DRAFT_618007 [Bisporella sp. PMI_857]
MAPASPPLADAAPSLPKTADHSSTNPSPNVKKTNHDPTAGTMGGGGCDDDRDAHGYKDDAATIAAGEELKQTRISDKEHNPAEAEKSTRDEPVIEDREMQEPATAATPEPTTLDATDEVMRERITSPKKKRGRDVDDDTKDVESPQKDGSIAEGSLNGGRTTRSGPEKKRPRDTSEEFAKDGAKSGDKDASDISPSTSSDNDSKKSRTSSPKPTFGSGLTGGKPQTSSAAFAGSGFASLASSSTSPFGAIGASKPSVFGGNTSGFGALASGQPSSIPTSTISGNTNVDKPASGFSFGTATSGFGALKSGSVFGSALGNGFAGAAGPKLSSFAAPGKDTVSSAKPAKPFGAPDSDAEESEEDDSDGGLESGDEEAGKITAEEKKKLKPVKIEDGEAGEATLLQVRARLYALESKEAGWKERGVGTLKVNVPRSCATFDDIGVPIPGSFDISGLEDETDENSPRNPRLIMRQENTHRVILNTSIIRAMEFKDKPSPKGAQVLFTAFEGDGKPVQMLLKMNENNAKLFKSELDSIKHEL